MFRDQTPGTPPSPSGTPPPWTLEPPLRDRTGPDPPPPPLRDQTGPSPRDRTGTPLAPGSLLPATGPISPGDRTGRPRTGPDRTTPDPGRTGRPPSAPDHGRHRGWHASCTTGAHFAASEKTGLLALAKKTRFAAEHWEGQVRRESVEDASSSW